MLRYYIYKNIHFMIYLHIVRMKYKRLLKIGETEKTWEVVENKVTANSIMLLLMLGH